MRNYIDWHEERKANGDPHTMRAYREYCHYYERYWKIMERMGNNAFSALYQLDEKTFGFWMVRRQDNPFAGEKHFGVREKEY